MFDQTNNFVRKLSGKLMVKTKFKIPNSSGNVANGSAARFGDYLLVSIEQFFSLRRWLCVNSEHKKSPISVSNFPILVSENQSRIIKCN